MRAIAFKVAQLLGTDPGARNVNYNWMEPTRTVRIRVDQDQARLLGLSLAGAGTVPQHGRLRHHGNSNPRPQD